MSTKRTRRSLAQAGFTLIELMVAMLAGSIVITGAYYMSDVSAAIFSDQLRRSETQMTLRAATEQIRRDIGRAGFMGVRDTSEIVNCKQARGLTGGMDEAIAPRVSTAVSVTASATGRQVLTLVGNMTTTDQYFLHESTNGTTLAVSMAHEGFRRSFLNPVNGTFIDQRFREAFFPVPGTPGPGRMVSVFDLKDTKVYLRDITGAITSTVPPTLVLNTALPLSATRSEGCGTVSTAVIAPISTIRYAMEIPDATLARVGGRSYMTGGLATAPGALHPVLVRSEINPATDQPIPETRRVVLDSIVDVNEGFSTVDGFRVGAVWDNGAGSLVYTPTPETMPAIDRGKIRSLVIQLIVESAERIEGDQVHQQRVKNARRALSFEVMMPNLAHNSGQF